MKIMLSTKITPGCISKINELSWIKSKSSVIVFKIIMHNIKNKLGNLLKKLFSKHFRAVKPNLADAWFWNSKMMSENL